jgi:predicted transporter
MIIRFFTIVHLIVMHSCTVVYIRVHASGCALCILVMSPNISVSVHAHVIIYGVIFTNKCYVMLSFEFFFQINGRAPNFENIQSA